MTADGKCSTNHLTEFVITSDCKVSNCKTCDTNLDKCKIGECLTGYTLSAD